ncbi:S9 family peptidase [Mangrovibacterium diazotrophicum]|uniref:Dipeptidyl aminopeptidase/acylaminoacyl peptidase n=1 Tax=Mangrovibacterium diazotrophicum TaxID=1261403 RepID=A0A419W815_9BACT|nr:prolyl oligopeptidase family serine peptidase [Mangrovibacterium diazotrophicum]RKD91585.1 dipeptidyl aminopeptidase/acylaminoacyl peptidase [Mangrovibacterium diazotrophicum]
MKKLLFGLLLFGAANLVFAQNKISCSEWKTTDFIQMYLPAFAADGSTDGKKFERADLLEKAQLDERPETKSWPGLKLAGDSLLSAVDGENQLVQLAGYLTTDRWVKAKMTIATNALFELYLDGQKLKSQPKLSETSVDVDLTLETGKHQLFLKLISTDAKTKFAASLATANDLSEARLGWTTNEKRTFTIYDVLNGESISSAKISPSGKYVLVNYSEVIPGSGKTSKHARVYDLEQKKNVFVIRNAEGYSSGWMPKTDRLTYSVAKDGTSDLFIYDLNTGEEQKVASAIQDLGAVTWSPNEDFLIYSQSVEAEKHGDLKRVYGNDDRLPYFRNRSYLYLLDLKSGLVSPLTAGYLSASLQDIQLDGTKILFSTERMDYSEVPFSKQNLYEMDVQTMQIDTVWSEKPYGGSCQYSPDGKQLLVTGGPECFGDLGVNVSEGRIPNSYDTQLYLFNMETKKAEALSRDFDPAINNAYWSANGNIYLSVTEKDYVRLYRFNLKTKKYTPIELPVDVLGPIDYAREKSLAVFEGTSISSPEKLYMLNLERGKAELLDYPKEQQLADVEFGKNEDWNFTNATGTTIYGRIYYPVNYDPAKKYPLIVNYYGGTSPISRSFGGRYPANTWAANGYLVYILQPSGATGFGQDFSALHVNGWGRDAIDDIIEGTQKFLAAHPSADAQNVGCIGASYGGFTTMLLQTRTDLFKTAIAHAGISAITSYWGEGYWGYSYSAGATKGSYPWNRKDIYVDNSPIYNADKFQNSILLLHGTSDTNVPVGESLQYYAALKILGKDVEMVLVDGQDHHILDYKKRIEWHQTIMSWFDKKLKNQPDEWNEMYPDKQF